MMTGSSLVGHVKPTGYVGVALKHVETEKLILVQKHRFVYWCWNPSFEFLDEKRIVNHKNGNKKMNCLSNLEDVTSGENNAKAFIEDPGRRGRMSETARRAVDLVIDGLEYSKPRGISTNVKGSSGTRSDQGLHSKALL